MGLFGSKRRNKEEVVLLLYEYVGTNNRMGGKWLVNGKKSDPLEKWLTKGWKLVGQSQSATKGFFSALDKTTVTYTLVRTND